LALSFSAVGLFSVLVVSVTVNFTMQRQFERYVTARLQTRNQEIATQIGGQHAGHHQLGDAWDVDMIRSLGVQALDEGVLLRVADIDGRTIWDALEYDSGLCAVMQQDITRRMLTRFPSMSGGYTFQQYPIRTGEATIGVLTVNYFGPFSYSDNEIFFIDTINRILAWTAAGSLLVSILLAWAMARGVSSPLVELAGVARRIAAGEHGTEARVVSSTLEVAELAESVNHLSRTLADQEALRRRLTGDVAHELRTPIATLQSHLEAMIDGIWEPTTERLSSCHEELVRLARLVSDLQTLARYEEQALELELEQADVTEEVGRSVALCRTEFEKKGIRIEHTGEPAPARVDRDTLRQVCLNLLSNALKYTSQGGSVRVETERKEGGALIRVSDTGVGIPAEDLPHIFERFYRVDPSRARGTGGAGVGLTIAREIVRAHHGSITVTSTPGAGSTFTVTLPA
jgi:signal transduction histidine kinase